MITRTARPIALSFLRHGLLCGFIALLPTLARSDPAAGLPAPIATTLHSPVGDVTSWDLPADLRLIGSGLESAADPATASGLRVVPRGNEMAALATVDLERTDRHFRAEVVEWFAVRSVTAGVLSDVVVRGSDRGLHLHVLGQGQYMLLWEARF